MRFEGFPAALLISVLVAAPRPAATADYCIDAATGDDGASGLCTDRAWQTFSPTICYAFVPGDRVLIAEGRYDFPITAWYMVPGVSWIGAGTELTTVAYTINSTGVPFC